MPFKFPQTKTLDLLINSLKNLNRYKKILISCAIAVLVVDILSLSCFRILDRFELVTLDFRYSLRLISPQKVNPDIAIIEIGEDTLNALGKWPLPRDYHASLIDVLEKYKAKSIIFDILFCEPTGWDNLLVEAAKKAGNVYFPFAFRISEKQRKGIPEANEIDAPLLVDLKKAAKGTGYINKIVDMDGKVRRVPLLMKFHGGLYQSMALKVACDYLGINPTAASFDNKGNIAFGDGYIPTDENGMVLLNFAGRWADTFEHYSYVDILASSQESSEGKTPRMDLNKLKGKVCFIGLTATGTQELGPIPIENSYPMPGVHANLFNMLTERSYLQRFSRSGNLAILIILAGLLLFLIIRVKPFVAFFVSMAVILGLLVCAILLFTFRGLWIDMVCPSIILFGIYLTVTIARYISEIRVREKIQKELAVAASIQKCFLPADIPSAKGLDIAVEMKTAKEVGGDLYDFIKLADARVGVMIGDVSGKGVPASLFMSKVETLFRVYSKNIEEPSSVISKLNDEVAADERSGLFTTLIYAIFDAGKKQLIFSDAGHLPMLLVHNGKIEKLVSEDGMAVGIMEGTVFTDKIVKLSKGDAVVFYTDGISEARDIKENEFGIDRLSGLVARSGSLSAQELLKLIIDEVRRFQGKAVQHDDMTTIVVKVN